MESNQFESEIDTLSKSFHSALKSLSYDAKQIDQLLSLSKILNPSSCSSLQSHPTQQDSENRNPNTIENQQVNDPAKQFTDTIMNQLEFLSDKISQMETKAATIQQVINEEKQALDAMQKTRNAALKQKIIIQNVWNELERQNVLDTLPGTELFRKGYRIHTIMPENQNTDQEEFTRNPPSASIDRRSSSVTVKTSHLTSQVPPTVISQEQSTTTTKSHKNEFDVNTIHLEPISPAEYQSTSKTLLGRISLTDLNSALAEIHQVLVQKYKRLQSPLRRIQDPIGSKGRIRSSIHDELSENGLPFVTEDELRKECAFFVLEATARGILRVLRSMNRIKHISCRQLQIRYVWLNYRQTENC
jgi:hypothetical protein